MSASTQSSGSSHSSAAPTFRQLGVAEEICEALDGLGVTRTFAIQELTLPIALKGTDIIGQARTGMGKTFGFGVPLLDRVFDDADVAELDGTPRALVIAPTRELAVQVCEDLRSAASRIPVRVEAIYGGRPFEEQIQSLEQGVDVVVGTPGRLLDLHQRGHLNLEHVAVLVLDEADEMLDLGFLPDMEKLLTALTHPHQSMLFSATMPGPILALARGFMNKPIHIRAEDPGEKTTHASIRQVVFQSHRMDKLSVLSRVLQARGRGRTVIFTRTKRTAADVAEDLAQRGFHVGAVHGDLGQGAREAALNAFRSGEIEILVATDVAARGIDVEDVTHVVNYQTPDDPKTYVHRIGRTGRAGQAGTAVTMVGYDEGAKWSVINDWLSLDVPQPPAWFSTSPELFEALDIPDNASDSVGPARRPVGGKSHSSRGEAGRVAREQTSKSSRQRSRRSRRSS